MATAETVAALAFFRVGGATAARTLSAATGQVGPPAALLEEGDMDETGFATGPCGLVALQRDPPATAAAQVLPRPVKRVPAAPASEVGEGARAAAEGPRKTVAPHPPGCLVAVPARKATGVEAVAVEARPRPVRPLEVRPIAVAEGPHPRLEAEKTVQVAALMAVTRVGKQEGVSSVRPLRSQSPAAVLALGRRLVAAKGAS